MKTKHGYLLLLFTVMFLFASLMACNSSTGHQEDSEVTAAEDSEVTAPEDSNEVIFWSQWSGDNALAFQTIIDEYNDTQGKEDGIFIKIEQVEDENMEMLMKLMAAKLSDTMPDIVHVAQSSFIAMAKNELFMEPPQDIQDYIKENYFDANASMAEYNDVYWGYPTEHQVMALFWNKDHFDEEGIEGPPKTWDEMREYAKRLTRYDENGEMERAGFLFTFEFSEAMMTQHISMFWGAGEDLFPTETTTNVSSDVGIQINELLSGMAEDGSTNANWLPWEDALNNGQGSMIMMDPWALNFNVRQKGIEGLYEAIHVAELPTPDGTPGPSMSRGFALCVTSGSKFADEAWSHLKWLNEGPECRMNDFMVNNFEFLPSHKGFDFPETWSDETKATYERILKISKPQPDLSDYEEAQEIIDNMKDEILLGGKDPTQAAKDCATELTQTLEEAAEE
jgi:multiple sugar transport system substrate-binding protein